MHLSQKSNPANHYQENKLNLNSTPDFNQYLSIEIMSDSSPVAVFNQKQSQST